MTVSSTRNVAVSYDGYLDDGELLSGAPTAGELVTSDLTINSVAISIADLEINGEIVLAGRAVQFSVTGVADGVIYRIATSADSDSTPPQLNLKGIIKIEGIADTD